MCLCAFITHISTTTATSRDAAAAPIHIVRRIRMGRDCIAATQAAKALDWPARAARMEPNGLS
jgi:hypothetical protein